jgi:hypothetical protein
LLFYLHFVFYEQKEKINKRKRIKTGNLESEANQQCLTMGRGKKNSECSEIGREVSIDWEWR